MSLLMEALRKAEEAKRKDGKETDVDQAADSVEGELSPELSSQGIEFQAESSAEIVSDAENGDLQADFDAALSLNSATAETATSYDTQELEDPESDAAPVDFDLSDGLTPPENVIEADLEEAPADSNWPELNLHPMQEGSLPSEPVSTDSDSLSRIQQNSLSSRESESQGGISAELPQENASSEAVARAELTDGAVVMEQPSGQNALIDDYASSQELSSSEEDVDNEEIAAWNSRAKKISNPKNLKLVVLAVVILLMVSGGVLFWFLGSNPEPQVVSVDPSRGFLGGPDPLEVVPLEQSPIEEAQQANGSVQSDAFLSLDEERISREAESYVIDTDLGGEFEIGTLSSAQNDQISSRIESNEVFSITQSLVKRSELAGLQSEASAAAQSGYNAHAREQYQWLLAVEPNHAEAIIGLARLDAVEGNMEAAREGYLRLLELDPSDPIARAGLLSLGQGDPLKEEADLKSLAARFPDTASLSFVLGNLFASQQRWNEAEGAYSKALSSAKAAGDDQLSPDYSFNLAIALEQLSKPEEAYIHYLEALELSGQVAPNFDPSLLETRIQQLGQRLR